MLLLQGCLQHLRMGELAGCGQCGVGLFDASDLRADVGERARTQRLPGIVLPHLLGLRLQASHSLQARGIARVAQRLHLGELLCR